MDDKEREQWDRRHIIRGSIVLFLLLVVVGSLLWRVGPPTYRFLANLTISEAAAIAQPKTTAKTVVAEEHSHTMMCQAFPINEDTVRPAPIAVEGTNLTSYLVCVGYPADTPVAIRVSIYGESSEVIDVDTTLTTTPAGVSIHHGNLGVVPAGLYVVEYRIGGRLVAWSFMQVKAAE